VVILPRPVSAGILDSRSRFIVNSIFCDWIFGTLRPVRIVRKRGIMRLAVAGYRFGEPNLPAKAISLTLKPQVSVRREALHIRASLYGAIHDHL
jgi:hypothetical protein